MLLNSSDAKVLKSKLRPRFVPPDGVGAAVGAHGFDAVDAHARELRTQAAHGDLAAFAGVARDHHAGNALQRFGEVQIGKVGDVFGDDHVDRADLFLLGVERLVQARAETGYHHFFDGLSALGHGIRSGFLGDGAGGESPAWRWRW